MKMKTELVMALIAAAAVGFGQSTTQKTKQTKVGITTHGVEITRTRTTTTKTSRRPGRVVDNQAIHVVVDGKEVSFVDQGPIMRGGRVLVPLRGVFERMGADVTWDRASNTVTAHRGERMIRLPLNGTTATVGGQTVTLDQPAVVLNGRALVPLRFLGESLGATVDWAETTMTVTIHSGA